MASRLADFHLIAQARLRSIVRAAVSRIWRALGSYDEADVPVFINEVVPVMFEAQSRSVALTDAYLARTLERPPIGIQIENPRGVDPRVEWRRPFVEVWSQLQKQTDWQEAVGMGETRATTLADTDVQLAHTHALREIGERDDLILGYQRVTKADACDFCKLVATRRYHVSDLLPIHNNCGCTVAPITAANRDQFFGNPKLDRAHLPDGVAIEEHGELGPVLVDPAHDFTGPDALAA